MAFPLADIFLYIIPTIHAHTKMFITGATQGGGRVSALAFPGGVGMHPHAQTLVIDSRALGLPLAQFGSLRVLVHSWCTRGGPCVMCAMSHCVWCTTGGSFNYIPSAKQVRPRGGARDGEERRRETCSERASRQSVLEREREAGRQHEAEGEEAQGREGDREDEGQGG